jgi:acetylornithine deacetylase
MNDNPTILADEMITLLQELIRTPSFSREEGQTAMILSRFFDEKNISYTRHGNNIFVQNHYFREDRPTLLLNSHHDTVKPNVGYTKDPFDPIIEEGKLFGLGSNDAGGPLVALLGCFLHFYKHDSLAYNIIFAATAEEEISGEGGISSILDKLPAVDCAIIGEPTGMELAVAERGLMVLDCRAKGVAGHAAREEGDNALYHAVDAITWFRDFKFPKISDLLGPNKMTVTVIETSNKAHNVIPAECNFVVDVRVNELYSFEEVLEIIRENVACEVKPRSTRLRSSLIPVDHPLVAAGMKLGKRVYGSPTTSDKALVPFPALKMGPGDSARSHSADEFIYVSEIRDGISTYIQLLNQLV